MPAIALGKLEKPNVGDVWRLATCKMDFNVRHQGDDGWWRPIRPHLIAWADFEECVIIGCLLDINAERSEIVKAFEMTECRFGKPRKVYLDHSPSYHALSDYFSAQDIDCHCTCPYRWRLRAVEHLLGIISNWFSSSYADFRNHSQQQEIPIEELPTIDEVQGKFRKWVQTRLKTVPAV